MNLKGILYAVVMLSSFILLMAPCISAVDLHVSNIQVRKTASEEVLSKISFFEDDVLSAPLVEMIQMILRIYTIGFILIFILSLFVTIPVAIWITYSGGIIEILLTAFGLSFVTAFKWPVLLLDVILKIIQGGLFLDQRLIHTLESIK